ncbi:MAG: DUF58 domain-containing protein [Thermoplasmata archaeon]
MSGAPPSPGVDRWTSRTYVLLAFGGALLAVAVAFRTPVPVFFALPLLIAPFAAAMSSPRQLARVNLAWGEVGIGADMEVRGSLRGAFEASAPDISIELSPPAGITMTRDLEFERSPREVRFATRWRVREPTITSVAAPPVIWRDSMGLSERRLPGTRPALAIERYPPELHTLTSVRLERTIPLYGETPSRRLGESGEFASLRPARTSEPFRRINWRASARVGRLVANEYDAELTGDLIVLLDLRPSTLGRAYDARLLGIARAAAYGIALSFLRTKVRLGFASFGEFVEAVPLSTGRLHRVRVLRGILACRVADHAEDALRCAVGLRRFFPPGITTLIISSWTEDPSLDLAPYLRRHGFPVVTLSPSPIRMREGMGGLASADDTLARRIEQLERRARLASLWSYGPVIDWENYWSLDGLVRSLRAPVRRRNV